MRRRKSRGKVIWNDAPDVYDQVKHLVSKLDLNWVYTDQLRCFRSVNSSARAYARIWGLSKVWQQALESKPHYVIEVLSENFDHLPVHEKSKILLHEIAHIPKNFSGSLLPHTRRRGSRNFHDRVEELFNQYRKSEK